MEAMTPPNLSGLVDPANVVDVDLFAEDTRQRWRALAAEWATRPPFFVINYGIPQLVVARYRDVKEVLMDPRRFTSDPPPQASARFDAFMGLPHLGAMDGAPHDRVRRILQPWFGRNGLAEHHPSIDRVIGELLDEIEARGNEFDAVSELTRQLIPRIMLGEMFGIPPEQREVFVTMNRELETVFVSDGYPQAYVDAFNACRAVVKELIAERERTLRQDFIGGLIAGRLSGSEPISDEEIIANVFAICAAAMTTTSTTTAMTLLAWVRNRDQFAQIEDEPGLARSAVEESLRLHPAGLFVFPRFVAEPTDVGGTAFPAGLPVHVCVAAADLDPEVYPDPLRFDIRRNPRGVLVFGHGPHFCAGSQLARKIIVTVLTMCMQRYPQMDLVDPDYEPIYKGQLGECAPGEMRMRLR